MMKRFAGLLLTVVMAFSLVPAAGAFSAAQGMAGNIALLNPLAPLGLDRALGQNDLPNLSLTDCSLTAELKETNNIHTRYEYAVIPQSPPVGFLPDWIALGSSADRGGSPLTASFLPSSSPYSIYLRIEGDTHEGSPVVRQEGITLAEPRVLFALEMIGPLRGGAGGSTWYFNAGGRTWETVTVAALDEGFIDISGLFGSRGAEFQLRRADRVPVEGGAPGEFTLTSPDISPLVLEGTLKPRPVFPREIAIAAFVSEQHPENWTLTGHETSAPGSSGGTLEFMAPGIEWTPFDVNVGLPLLTAAQQAARARGINYQFRVGASEANETPASTVRRIRQPRQTRAPGAKPDYNRETLKLRSGLNYFIGSADTARAEMTFIQASGEPVPINEALDNGLTVFVFASESGRRSRSAMQTVTLAPRGESPDQGEGLILNRNNAVLQRGFEYLGSRGRWGSFNKGDDEGWVRRRSTAKYNVRANTNTGFAASSPVRCTIRYSDADKRNISAIIMEQKQEIPLESWGLTALSGGSVAYNSFTDTVNQASIVLNSETSTVSFSIQPRLSAANTPLADSFHVSLNGSEIEAVSDRYALNGLNAGDVVTLTIMPRNRNIYRRSTATITILHPHERSPGSVAFGLPGTYGTVTVTMPEPVALGQSRTLQVDLVRLPERTVIHSETSVIVYTPDQARTALFDFRIALTGAGPGNYQLRAYFKGTATTSDSPAVVTPETSGRFTAADFGVNNWIVTTRGSAVSSTNNPRVGSEIVIEEMRDAFGNILTASAIQWYRVSGGVRTAIPQSWNAAAPATSYTPRDLPAQNDRGFTLEVDVFTNAVYTFRIPGTVGW
jgi:hypothetical protein